MKTEKIFDKNNTLDTLKIVGRVIEYWKEKEYKSSFKRKILVEIDNKVYKGIALRGTNAYKYRAFVKDLDQGFIICVNSNVLYDLPQEKSIKTILKKKIDNTLRV
jgi:hypothetical protein